MEKRIICFRGKTKGTREWIFGDLVHDSLDANSRIIPIGIKTKGCYPTEVIPESVGQSLHFFDSKMKMIFESDIIQVNDTHRRLVVKYANGCFNLHHVEPSYDGKIWGTVARMNELGISFEVIGNTTDNPELLK